MNDVSIVISVQDEYVRSEVAAILRPLPYATTLSRLPQIDSEPDERPRLFIVAVPDDGNEAASLVGKLLHDHPSYCAIFIIPKRPGIPIWAARFSSERVGFYATELIDAGLLSYITVFIKSFMS